MSSTAAVVGMLVLLDNNAAREIVLVLLGEYPVGTDVSILLQITAIVAPVRNAVLKVSDVQMANVSKAVLAKPLMLADRDVTISNENQSTAGVATKPVLESSIVSKAFADVEKGCKIVVVLVWISRQIGDIVGSVGKDVLQKKSA